MGHSQRVLAAAAGALALLTAPAIVAGGDQQRIVTLAPSLTEIAYAVGCGSQLVADTTFDDYPAAARSLPHVADLVNVDLERLSALHPTKVIALHDQEREAAPIASRLHIPVLYLPNRNIDDVFSDNSEVGQVCGTSSEAAQLSKTMRARIAAVAKRAARYKDKPRVFFLIDLPAFTAGSQSFLNDLIRLAGGVNAAGSIRQAYPNVSSESVLAMDPEVLIIGRAVQVGPHVLEQEPWRSISAMKNGRMFRPPSDDIIERNGPRIVEGLEWLVTAIHK